MHKLCACVQHAERMLRIRKLLFRFCAFIQKRRAAHLQKRDCPFQRHSCGRNRARERNIEPAAQRIHAPAILRTRMHELHYARRDLAAALVIALTLAAVPVLQLWI